MTEPNVHNAYADLPVIDFVRTTIKVADFVAYASGRNSTQAVRRASYVIFRNESGSGQKGINNNYAGFQADGDRRADKWLPLFSGTCVHREGLTGKWRRFLCFKDWHGCIDLLLGTIAARGLYVGGYAHPFANMKVDSEDDWPLAYYREWVQGDEKAEICPSDKASLLRQYQYGKRLFP